jgi:hypothetical protein
MSRTLNGKAAAGLLLALGANRYPPFGFALNHG